MYHDTIYVDYYQNDESYYIDKFNDKYFKRIAQLCSKPLQRIVFPFSKTIIHKIFNNDLHTDFDITAISKDDFGHEANIKSSVHILYSSSESDICERVMKNYGFSESKLVGSVHLGNKGIQDILPFDEAYTSSDAALPVKKCLDLFGNVESVMFIVLKKKTIVEKKMATTEKTIVEIKKKSTKNKINSPVSLYLHPTISPNDQLLEHKRVVSSCIQGMLRDTPPT